MKRKIWLYVLLLGISMVVLPGGVQAALEPSVLMFNTFTFGSVVTTGGTIDYSLGSLMALSGDPASISGYNVTNGHLTYSINGSGGGTVTLTGTIGTDSFTFGGNLTQVSVNTYAITAATDGTVTCAALYGVPTEMYGTLTLTPFEGGTVSIAMTLNKEPLGTVATPIPPAVLLLGTGLMGIGFIRKRTKK